MVAVVHCDRAACGQFRIVFGQLRRPGGPACSAAAFRPQPDSQHPPSTLGRDRQHSRCVSAGVSSSSRGQQQHRGKPLKPLEADNKPGFGAQGLFLVGFTAEEGQRMERWVGPELPISHCTDALLRLPLGQAVYHKDGRWRQTLLNEGSNSELPRVVFFSGLTGNQTIYFLESWAKSGTPEPAFSSVEQNGVDKPVHEHLENIMRAVAIHKSMEKLNDLKLGDPAVLKDAIKQRMSEQRTLDEQIQHLKALKAKALEEIAKNSSETA